MSAERLTHDSVVMCAAALVDDLGFSALTMTAVATELGVQQPALYRHIDGVDHLIRSLSLRARGLLSERLAAAAVGRAGHDAVRAMAHAWRQFVRDHPGLYEATDRAPSAGDPDLEVALDHLVDLLGRALGGFALSPEQTVHAARSMRSAIHGFCHLEAGREHPGTENLDQSYDHLIELLCAGFDALADRCPDQAMPATP